MSMYYLINVDKNQFLHYFTYISDKGAVGIWELLLETPTALL